MLKLQYFAHLMWRTNSLGKKSWRWERWKAWGEGGEREWDDRMASPTRWTWVWANCGREWGTGKPGLLQSVGSQRVTHNGVTEQQQSFVALELDYTFLSCAWPTHQPCTYPCINIKSTYYWDFPDSPDVKNLCFQCRGWGFHLQLWN